MILFNVKKNMVWNCAKASAWAKTVAYTETGVWARAKARTMSWARVWAKAWARARITWSYSMFRKIGFGLALVLVLGLGLGLGVGLELMLWLGLRLGLELGLGLGLGLGQHDLIQYSEKYDLDLG
jgi:hypothetical protein